MARALALVVLVTSLAALARCAPHAAQDILDNLLCGPMNVNQRCPNDMCCSRDGFCGTTPFFCSMPDNCQSAYGKCASDVYPSGPPTIADNRKLFGTVTYDVAIDHCTEPDTVALTFDDGPSLEVTGLLLDSLQAAGAKATFFVLGNANGRGPIYTGDYAKLLKRMVDEGHQIASHTYTHSNFTTINYDSIVATIAKNERAIATVIGKYPTYLRTPYNICGEDCKRATRSLGYHRIMQDLDSRDTELDWESGLDRQKAEDIIKNHFNGNPKNALIIMHDTNPWIIGLTKWAIEVGKKNKAKRYRFVTVGECLNDPPENWYRTPQLS